MEVFFWWITLSIIVAVFANSKGKSWILYLVISLILSPLLGLLIALVSGDNTKKKCFNCGQTIDVGAKVCPFCKVDMNITNTTNKGSKIIKINNSLSKLVLDKESTPYSMDDLKRILIENYDEKYRAEISTDNDSIFTIKGKAGEFGLNYIQIESKETQFIIQAFNTNIPIEIEGKKETVKENINSNISNLDKLIELGKLYKDGLLTKEEFEEQKNLLKNK
jgi:RNA polymerase subunit RPABC4/transcription elongation factor Spt4